MFGRTEALGDKCTRWNTFYIYNNPSTDNPSELLCDFDVILGDKSRVFRNDLSCVHNKQITFSETDQNSFPWRRHRAVGGCRQRTNVPSVRANGCWGFGSGLGGDHVLSTGRDSLTVRCIRQRKSSSAALDPFHEKPNQRTACSMDGKTKGRLPPAFLDGEELKFGSREMKKRKV